MHPTGDYNGSPYRNFLWPRSKVGDDGHLAIVAGNSLTDDSLSYSILRLRLTKILKELRAIRVSVRVAMRHVHLVVIVLELNLESQGVVEAASFFLQGVLEVADVLPISVPPDSLAIVTVRHLL